MFHPCEIYVVKTCKKLYSTPPLSSSLSNDSCGVIESDRKYVRMMSRNLLFRGHASYVSRSVRRRHGSESNSKWHSVDSYSNSTQVKAILRTQGKIHTMS